MRPIHTTQREIHVTTKKAFAMALRLKRQADQDGIDFYPLVTSDLIPKARKTRRESTIDFVMELHVLMHCFEFFSADALYLLTD